MGVDPHPENKDPFDEGVNHLETLHRIIHILAGRFSIGQFFATS